MSEPELPDYVGQAASTTIDGKNIVGTVKAVRLEGRRIMLTLSTAGGDVEVSAADCFRWHGEAP